MENLLKKINTSFEIITIDKNFAEIKTGLEFKKSIAVRIFLKKVQDKYILSDNKNTLRYMNTLYNLSSKDVIQCVNDIVKQYKFRINKGEIFGEITQANVKQRFLEMIICAQTLANMFIFFDEPIE